MLFLPSTFFLLCLCPNQKNIKCRFNSARAWNGCAWINAARSADDAHDSTISVIGSWTAVYDGGPSKSSINTCKSISNCTNLRYLYTFTTATTTTPWNSATAYSQTITTLKRMKTKSMREKCWAISNDFNPWRTNFIQTRKLIVAFFTVSPIKIKIKNRQIIVHFTISYKQNNNKKTIDSVPFNIFFALSTFWKMIAR